MKNLPKLRKLSNRTKRLALGAFVFAFLLHSWWRMPWANVAIDGQREPKAAVYWSPFGRYLVCADGLNYKYVVHGVNSDVDEVESVSMVFKVVSRVRDFIWVAWQFYKRTDFIVLPGIAVSTQISPIGMPVGFYKNEAHGAPNLKMNRRGFSFNNVERRHVVVSW